MPVSYARSLPYLEQVTPALPEWKVQSSLVTHVDVHRTDKVQSLLRWLKDLVLAMYARRLCRTPSQSHDCGVECDHKQR